KDSIKAPLLELGASEELAGQASYVLPYELMRDIVQMQGLSLIVDSSTSFVQAVEVARGISAEAGAVLGVIHCEADMEVRRQRMAGRHPRASQPLEPGWKAGDGRVTYEHLPADTLHIDTDRPADELVDEALCYVLGEA